MASIPDGSLGLCLQLTAACNTFVAHAELVDWALWQQALPSGLCIVRGLIHAAMKMLASAWLQLIQSAMQMPASTWLWLRMQLCLHSCTALSH